MADQTVTIRRIQLRRSFTAGYRPSSLAEGEGFINLADRLSLIGDGVTEPAQLPAYPLLPGVTDVSGLSSALAGKAALGHTAVADASYTVQVTDVHVGFTALAAPRVVTLCDVDLYPLGQDLVVVDEAGTCSDTNTITVQVGSGTSDTIPQTSTGTIILASPYASARLRRGASNVWLIV